MKKTFQKFAGYKSLYAYFIIQFPLNFSGWLKLYHSPNFMNLWVVTPFLFCLALVLIFREKVVIDDNGISYYYNFFQKKQLQWNDISFISGLSDDFKQTVNIYDKLTSSDNKMSINANQIDNFEGFIQLLKDKVIDDKTGNEKIIPVQTERRYAYIRQFGVILIFVSLFSWFLVNLLTSNVYLPITQVQNNHWVFWVAGTFILIISAIWFVLSSLNKEYKKTINEMCICLLTGLMMSILTYSNGLRYYNHHLLQTGQLSEHNILLKLKRQNEDKDYQYWELVSVEPNKSSFTFSLSDWRGINANLQSKNTYQVSAYQGKYGYIVITPEQFRNAVALPN